MDCSKGEDLSGNEAVDLRLHRRSRSIASWTRSHLGKATAVSNKVGLKDIIQHFPKVFVNTRIMYNKEGMH